MKFNDDRLLLASDLAAELYGKVKDLPVIDYHSHLNPREIAEDKAFYNLTQLWLGGDHYKWRLMRNSGVDERLITGDAEDVEKFRAFAAILPLAVGNPIYTWCHLELKKYFGIEIPLSARTADEIYSRTERMMADGSFTAKNVILRSGVETVCTTDDPADDLKWHEKIAEDGFGVKVLPSFRPDKAVHVEAPVFADYVCGLTGMSAPARSDIERALAARISFFAERGCVVSDHALTSFVYRESTPSQLDEILAKALAGKPVSAEESEEWQTALLLFLSREYCDRNWAMQLHFNCLRNVNAAMFARLGPDTGYDCVNRSSHPEKLAMLLDKMGENRPKTVVYSLDPDDDKLLNTVINCFQSGGRGRLQHGSAWWFNDTEKGIRRHLETLSEYSVLGNFVGMLTDSRSFTSYARHDFFRRILCDYLANLALEGKYPADALLPVAENICYRNVKEFLFG